MAAGVDVGIDAHGHAAPVAVRPRDGGDAIHLARRLRIDGRHAQADGARRVPPRVLPTPVKTMSSGANPARSATSISPPEFASAPRAERSQLADDGRRRIRLDGVVQPMRARREARVERPVALAGSAPRQYTCTGVPARCRDRRASGTPSQSRPPSSEANPAIGPPIVLSRTRLVSALL